MRNNLLIIGLLSICCVVFAFTAAPTNKIPPEPNKVEGKRVQWMTWDEAILASKKARERGEVPKKIFVDIYTDWCGWCKKMDQQTFEHATISTYLNDNFYPVKFNAEQKSTITFQGHEFKFVAQGRRGYHELAAALLDGKMSYPTVIFLNEDFELLQRIPGFLDIDIFDIIMHYLAEEHYKKTPWADYQQNYKVNN
ncbi:MAG: thioredoxin family protein [Aureispira sp.]